MMTLSASVNAPQMTGLWWEVHNVSGKIDSTMGRDMCDFDEYNINKLFFSSLINMNTLPDGDYSRPFSTTSFNLPTEVEATNYQLTVCEIVRPNRATSMVNTGPDILYVGQFVGIVPPLSYKDTYCVTACESGEEYVFPLTVSSEGYNKELGILLKSLTLLEEYANTTASTEDVNATAGRVAASLSNNIIFSEMDTTAFQSKGDALLHLLGMFRECSQKLNPAIEFQTNTVLEDIGKLRSVDTALDERVKAVDRIWRNRACFWMDRVNVVARCMIEETYEYSNREVGPIPVECRGMCKVRVI